MDKISVVVPVYNVKKYLEKSFESIADQTYDNLEIVLVDDGATDGSGKLCDELAKKDNRVKVCHKVNGGLSSARNHGLLNATGDYIIFIERFRDLFVISLLKRRLQINYSFLSARYMRMLFITLTLLRQLNHMLLLQSLITIISTEGIV